ncbi:MAG: ComF family protein [Spirochaetales bacterium]|nr:ComF family protein [Spirochaetales bacterium]
MLKDVLLDTRCVICGSKDLSEECHLICDQCLAAFDETPNDICPICGHPLTDDYCPSCYELGQIYFDSYHYLQTYTGFFKNVVYKLKKNDEFIMNRLCVSLLLRKGWLSKDIPVTIVPDTWCKAFRRGRGSLRYVLRLLRKEGFTVMPNIYRKRWKLMSRSQKSKSKTTRINEIEQGYYLPDEHRDKYHGEIYLIDDVYTTGATVNYGAQLLKDAGFDKVHCITFFRAVLNDD